jgi:MYXO-CTERM domain-containing protein
MKLLTSLRRWWVLVPLVLPASAALAHAGFPDTTSVTVRRDHPEDLFVGATFGAVISRDSGKTWQWLCPQGLGYGGWPPESYLWQPNGDLITATGNALLRSRDGGCTWAAHEYFSSRSLWPARLMSPASTPSRVWVVTNRSGVANGLYRSDDGGENFTDTTLQSSNGIFTGVQEAPSDAKRLYVSGQTPEGIRLSRSDDGGATWTHYPQPFTEYRLPDSPSGPYDFIVLKVAPNDPNHLWARVSAFGWTYVLESKDGGQSFQSILHPPDQERDGLPEYIIGIEASADGNTLWVATPTRLYRKRTGEAAVLLSLPTGNACVERQSDDSLLVCGADREHNWVLARTRDEGETYTPLFSLTDIQAPTCPAGTPVHDRCLSAWPQFAASIGLEVDAGTPDPQPVDAGTGAPEPTPPAKGCSCSSTEGLLPAAFLFAFATLRRFRRRHPENHQP